MMPRYGCKCIIDDKNVQVDWDPAPDIAGSEEGGTSPLQFLPSKWNKDGTAGAWRLDVDIHEEDDLDDELSVLEEEGRERS